MLRSVADTHTIIWYLYDDPRLSEPARAVIESAAADVNQIGICAITLAEIVYLSEKGRIHPQALGRVLAELDEPGSVLRELPLDRAVVTVMASFDRNVLPDMPDRIIAATAQLYGVPVISRDREIRLSTIETVW